MTYNRKGNKVELIIGTRYVRGTAGVRHRPASLECLDYAQIHLERIHRFRCRPIFDCEGRKVL